MLRISSRCAGLAVSVLLALGAANGFAITLDPNFGSGGIASAVPKHMRGTSRVNDAAMRADGGFVVAGTGNMEEEYTDDRWTVGAFTSDGKLDKTFGRSGWLARPNLRKYGSRFNYAPSATAVLIQPDGKVLVGGAIDVATLKDLKEFDENDAGDCNCFALRTAFAVMRYTATGKLDRSFGDHGVRVIRSVVKYATENSLDGQIVDMILDRQGRIVILGNTQNWPRRAEMLLYRMSANGKIDRRFGGHGKAVVVGPGPFGITGLAASVTSDGKILVASDRVRRSKKIDTDTWVVSRFTDAGRLDATFGHNGQQSWRPLTTNTSASSAIIDSEGRVTFAGSEWLPDPVNYDGYMYGRPVIGRLAADGAPDAGFGDAGVLVPPLPEGATRGRIAALAADEEGILDLAATAEADLPPPGGGTERWSWVGKASAAGQPIEPFPGTPQWWQVQEDADRYLLEAAGILNRPNGFVVYGDRSTRQAGSRIALAAFQP